jgi:hypothetical protein
VRRPALTALLFLLAAFGCNAILGNEHRNRVNDGSVGGNDSGGNGAGGNGAHGPFGGLAGTDGFPEGGSDAGAAGQAAGGTSAEGGGGQGGRDCGEAETAAELCSGKVVYVSSELGDDSYNGCSPCYPKKTIRSALEMYGQAGFDAAYGAGGASGDELSGYSVRVCAGVYSEAGLELHQPISLRGGYDCDSWERSAGYGHPLYDAVNRSEIVNASDALQGATLIVSGADVGPSTIIDGFTIHGFAGSLDGVVAVAVRDGAAPTISNNQIFGGEGANDPIGSIGIGVSGSSYPDIYRNEIAGGSGTGTSVGSAGIAVDGEPSAPYIHENTIDGGSGQAFQQGSVGLYLETSGQMTDALGRPIEGNTIYGGTGLQEGPISNTRSASAAVWLYGTGAFDLIANEIDGGDSTQAGGVMSEGGIAFAITYGGGGSEGLRILRNRIYGGEVPGTYGQSRGIFVNGGVASGAELIIANNMIHGGKAYDYAYGVFLLDADFAKIAFNDIFAGIVSTATDYINPAVYLSSSIGTTLRSNIIATFADEPAVGIMSTHCPEAFPIKVLANNLVIDSPNGLLGFTTPDCGSTQYASVQVAQTKIETCTPSTAGACQDNGGSVATGNFTLRSDCTNDSRCYDYDACNQADGSTTSCMSLVFAGWNAGDVGKTELFGPGWLLGTHTPCTVVQGGADPDLEFSQDLFGQQRGAPNSIGAVEFDDTCTSSP